MSSQRKLLLGILLLMGFWILSWIADGAPLHEQSLYLGRLEQAARQELLLQRDLDRSALGVPPTGGALATQLERLLAIYERELGDTPALLSRAQADALLRILETHAAALHDLRPLIAGLEGGAVPAPSGETPDEERVEDEALRLRRLVQVDRASHLQDLDALLGRYQELARDARERHRWIRRGAVGAYGLLLLGRVPPVSMLNKVRSFI